MSCVTMRVQNDRALEVALTQLSRQLGPRSEGRVVKTALRAGGAEILKAAKRNAPKGRTGNLRRSLQVSKGRRIRRYARGLLLAVLGPSWPLGAHGHLVERGTRARSTKSGASRGVMPATPFLEPAFREKAPTALDRIKREMLRGIEREWERHVRKMAAR